MKVGGYCELAVCEVGFEPQVARNLKIECVRQRGSRAIGRRIHTNLARRTIQGRVDSVFDPRGLPSGTFASTERPGGDTKGWLWKRRQGGEKVEEKSEPQSVVSQL